jgi:hypothetical protein
MTGGAELRQKLHRLSGADLFSSRHVTKCKLFVRGRRVTPDDDHLHLLAVFHYVVGGLAFLFSFSPALRRHGTADSA